MIKLRHELKTPTFLFTTLGILLLLSSRSRRGRLAAALSFLVAAGGIPIAVATQVQRQGEVWEWGGILRSLRRPNGWFWYSLFAHLPQLLASLWLFCSTPNELERKT